MRGNRLILYRTIGYLWHTAWPDGKNRFRGTEQAAQLASVKLQTRGIAASAEIDQAITALKLNGMTTIIVQPSPFTYRERSHIVGTASDNGLATIFGFPAAARDGALLAYGPDYLPHESAGSLLRQPNSQRRRAR
jgi:hypothetical protein